MDFHEEALLAPRPTPKLEDHPLSAVRDYLFNLFAVILHIGGRSSIRNLRTGHAMVTGTHLSHEYIFYVFILHGNYIKVSLYINYINVSLNKDLNVEFLIFILRNVMIYTGHLLLLKRVERTIIKL